MTPAIKIKVRNLCFYYQTQPVLEAVNLDIPARTITSITGPSGQGKSSFLTVLNRIWEGIDQARVNGEVEIDFGRGFENIYARHYDLPLLRQRVGMVFQTPNPLPMSIEKNVAFPLKLVHEKEKGRVARKVAEALARAGLWEEVKDRLSHDATTLSGGQQQRLCLARALVLNPQVLLLDEPTSSLDEASVAKIEQLLLDLKAETTIIMVSHYADQVKRIADQTYLLSDRRLTRLGAEAP